MLRERVLVRRGFLAAPERADAERLEPAPEDFARPDAGFLAAVLPAELLRALLLPVVDLARVVDLREPLERPAPPLALRAPLLLLRADDPELVPEPSSAAHLPDITRCAASATASAISEPNFVALAIMLLAACEAVSAASRPASRIARRALGLALIAAAAAARPAASISLLIAPLASFSAVLSPELEDDLELVLRADLAIARSPSVAEKTLQDRNGSRKRRRCTEIRIC
ncbi:MAG: hypothetical protein ACJ8FT_01170 [Sphingomonas sp.]